MIKMTFLQYIQNPLGKENAVFSHRNMYKELYTNKLSNILVREGGTVKYKLYFDKKNDRYFVYFKIPSEVVKDFYYDTVIEFYTPDSKIQKSRSLKEYLIKFFSNDPSFIFTFAYAFNKQNLLIDDLKSKIPKKALTDKAVVKNPKVLIGYVKSIYFAFLLMNINSLFAKIVYETTGFVYNKSVLLDQIMDGSKKIDLRQEKGIEVEKLKKIKNKKEINKSKRTSTKPFGNTDFDTSISTTKRTHMMTPRIKNSTSVKLVNKVSRRRKRK